MKSVTVAELGEKGELTGAHGAPEADAGLCGRSAGTYMELDGQELFMTGLSREDYYHITLTDEEDVRDAVGKLRVVYPNLMKLDYDNSQDPGRRDRSGGRSGRRERRPWSCSEEFYEKQNGQGMSAGAEGAGAGL